MRLGLILYGSLDTLSGGYLYDRMLVNHLRAAGDEVDIISLPPGLPGRAGWRNYAQHLAYNFLPGLIQQLRVTNCELLLQDELNHPSLFLLNHFLRGRYPTPPRVSIVHHLRCCEQRPAWQNFFYRQIEKIYLDSVDGFICNSHTTLAAVQRLAQQTFVYRLSSFVPRPYLVAQPGGNQFGPGLDADQIRERAMRPGPLKLLFVGNLIPRKGLDTLLEALARIPEGWELNVVGSLTADARYAAKIRQRISQGFAPHVKLYVRPATERSVEGRKGNSCPIQLLGSIDAVRMTHYFSESHVLVVPSTYEGFGIVYLEGMGFGLPAIATTAGAASEIITHAQTGFLVEPNNAAALAHPIQMLIHDRGLLARLSLAARERFLIQPTWEQNMATARGFLQKIVSQRAGG